MNHWGKTREKNDMPHNDYPQTVSEVLNAQMPFKRDALAAVWAFRRSKPWRGVLPERQAKYRVLHTALCAVYGLDPRPQLVFGNDETTSSGSSCFIPALNKIILRGRLSFVTYTHELCHARGMGEMQATRWSVNLYRRIWPKLYARCRHDRHMLRAPTLRSDHVSN